MDNLRFFEQFIVNHDIGMTTIMINQKAIPAVNSNVGFPIVSNTLKRKSHVDSPISNNKFLV